MESLTLSAVRPMSINGSTDAMRPTISIGSPMVPSTIRLANVAPPPTPATPNELITMMAISMTTHVGSNTLIPTVGAMSVAIIAG